MKRFLLAGMAALVAAVAAPATAETEWSVASFDAGGLRLDWKNTSPGKSAEAASQPSKAHTAAMAIAPGTVASAVLESVDGKTAGLQGDVTVSPPLRYRDALIAALSWNPGNGVAPGTARIRITFKPSSQSAFRSAFPPPETNPAEIALASWIVNYPQSRNLRSAPSAPLGKKAADGPSPGATLPKQRLVLKTAGENIEVLDYDALRKTGIPIGKIDPRFMHLYRDGVDVPFFIQGEDDGHWDPGDYLEFIGRRAAGQTTYNSFYAATSAFILVWDTGVLGLRVPRVPVASRTGGLVPISVEVGNLAKPFTVDEHLENDVDVLRIGSTSEQDIVDLGSRVQASELTDFWFWTRLSDKDALEVPFVLNFTPAAQATGSGGSAGSIGSLQVTINLKGITNNPNANPDHHLKFLLNGSDISLVGGENHDAIWEGQDSYTWVSPPINPSVLKSGNNKLTIQKVNDLKTTDNELVQFQDAYLNYIELHFPASYAVYKDRIRFSNSFADSLGTKLFTLTGFSKDAVSMWDVQGRKLANFGVKREGSGYSVSFLDSLAGATSYIACTLDNREVPTAVLDTLPDLLNPAQGADYIVITQKYMVNSALDSLLDFRRKQGLRCAVVFADQIYQAFGDGSMDPAAIRRFTTYAYNNWPRPAPTFINLVGDASFWFEKRSGALQLTTVPTHLVNIRGWGVAANDDYFAKVSGDDDLADMFVGRIPVSTHEDLSHVVRKTILLEKSRPPGHWKNKALLISGYEASFTAQNYVLQGIAAANDRQISRVDLFPASPHYESASQRLNFYDQLDSGFNLVSFIGHGGGAIWSDAGVLTLKALNEGRLRGDYPIPLVSSVTCLTGYFEDVSAPSLGEEMVRLEKGGAAGFYGAAGYISTLAGEALSTEMVKAATSNAYGTIGAITTQAETMVKLLTGDAFLPILAEFNLLGDPALAMSFPSHEGGLILASQTLSGKAGLKADGSSLAVDQGDGVATVYLGDSTESNSSVKVDHSAFSESHDMGGPVGSVQNGKIVVDYWNEKEARVVSAPFSTLDWLIDSVSIDPANAAPGDSVRISLKLSTAYGKIAFDKGVAFYAIGGDKPPLFPEGNQAVMASNDGIHYQTVNKAALEIPATDLAHPRIHLAFRLNVQVLDDQGQVLKQIPDLSSRTYSLPLSDLAGLEMAAPAFRLPVQDKLGIWVAFHNKGFGTAAKFSVALVQDAVGSSPATDTSLYSGKLAFGQLDSIFFPLQDSMVAGKRLRAFLIPSRDGELAQDGRSQDTVFTVQTAILDDSKKFLNLDTAGAFIRAVSGSPHRVFSRPVIVSSLPPHLSPAAGSLPVRAFQVETSDPSPGSFVIGLTSDGKPLAKIAAAAQPASWHYREPLGQVWLKLDSAGGSLPPPSAKGFRNGIYALLSNTDVTGPIIQLSSHGQVLLPDDYVPLHTPIDVVIRDGQGVDLSLHPPVMTSREQSLDSLNHAQESGNLFPTLARINFLPKHKADRDSLEVVARDVSGNVSRRSLLYRLGDDLAIRDLGSYPNPFADTATFVFSLTDYCDKVDLKVYSRAGRLVRSLEERNVVGYQEVVWDGHADGGGSIANGLYFLKVTATAGGKESTRIFKLFKKLRK
jgi:hypothetical protein